MDTSKNKQRAESEASKQADGGCHPDGQPEGVAGACGSAVWFAGPGWTLILNSTRSV